MFRCFIHHPQGEFRKLAQNCQQFERFVIKYKIYQFCRLTMFLQRLKAIYSRNSQLTPKYVSVKINNQQNKNTKTAAMRY